MAEDPPLTPVTPGRSSTGRRSSRLTSRNSQISGASSGEVTFSSLKVTKDGRLEETGENSDGSTTYSTNLSELFLSGRLPHFAQVDETLEAVQEEGLNEGDDEVKLMYFPDPPCVMPVDQDESAEQPDTQGCGLQDYWKRYASWLDAWPTIQEAKERNEGFIQTLGRGRVRTSSIVDFRVFVNVFPGSVAVRSSLSQSDAAKTSNVVRSGEMVSVTSMEEIDGVKYWRLRNLSGYVCETKDGKALFMEAQNVEIGRWWYRVVGDECLEVRSTATFSQEARTGWILGPQELAVVVLRIRIAGNQFVLLGDGRGWLFTQKPVWLHGGLVRPGDRVFQECEADFVEAGQKLDFRHAVPPTNDVVEVGLWTYVVQRQPVLCIGAKQHGTLLSPGTIFKADKRTTANGSEFQSDEVLERVWVRLQDGRGWVPLHGDNGKEQIMLQDPNDLTYPTWFMGDKNLDKPAREWMTGFA